MQPVPQSVHSFTPEQLRELASQPNTTVMEPKYDKEFESWSETRVERCASELRSITRAARDSEEARRVARESPHLSEFAECYRHMFQRLTDPEFANDDVQYGSLLQLIRVRGRVERGEMSEDDAMRTVSRVIIERAQPAHGATTGDTTTAPKMLR